MTETIHQALRRARNVFILADEGYTDRIAPFRVPTTKAAARALIKLAPKERKPTALWDDGDLVLTPEAWKDND